MCVYLGSIDRCDRPSAAVIIVFMLNCDSVGMSVAELKSPSRRAPVPP